LPAAEKIGEWDTSQLTKFVQQLLQDSEFLNNANKTFEELHVTRKLYIDDEAQFLQVQTTVGGAGAAPAPPATPDSYARVIDAYGNVRLIPLYKASL